MKREFAGSVEFPLVEQIRDGIRVYGLKACVHYYSKRLTRFELRFFMRLAYIGTTR